MQYRSGEHMSDVVVYLTGDAVSLFHGGEVYLVVLSGSKSQILFCKLSVLSCDFIAERCEDRYSFFKI